MATTRALDAGALGAWLVKASASEPETLAHLRDGFTDLHERCVRPSYRTALVASGQPVLLWVSGAHPDHPAGVHAHGWTTGPATDGTVPVALVPLRPPLLRRDLLGHPVLSGLEVLRMPAGSNPSYATPQQLAALVQLCPELAGG